MQNMIESPLGPVAQRRLAMIRPFVAGGHEVSHSMADINSDFTTLRRYMERVNKYVDACDRYLDAYNHDLERTFEDMTTVRRNLRIEHALEELLDLVNDSIDGVDKVKTTVEHLKTLSRSCREQPDLANLNHCLDATLNILWHEIKQRNKVVKHYGELPFISCYPQQIGYVFSTLLFNVVQSIDHDETFQIRTSANDASVVIEVHFVEKQRPVTVAGCERAQSGESRENFAFKLCREIVRKHSGSLLIEKSRDRDVCYRILLPVK